MPTRNAKGYSITPGVQTIRLDLIQFKGAPLQDVNAIIDVLEDTPVPVFKVRWDPVSEKYLLVDQMYPGQNALIQALSSEGRTVVEVEVVGTTLPPKKMFFKEKEELVEVEEDDA